MDIFNILLVDDDVTCLKQAQTILAEHSYKIAATLSGKQALQYLEKRLPDLILLDVNMPDMDGFETYAKIRMVENGKNVPIIFLTGESNIETELKCFEVGAVDFIKKPFVPDVLISRVSRTLAIENYKKNLEKMVAKQVEEYTRLQENVLIGTANLIESRDGSTGEHVKNTKRYVEILIRELQKRGMYEDILTESYIKNTIRSSVLHDVGKIKVSDTILCKPGKLNDDEFASMRTHAKEGGDIIRTLFGDVTDKEYLDVAENIARYHHERWDGKGYPEGLGGECIPLCARIMAIADVYDALVAERCYKKPMRPLSRVFDLFRENKGTQFDPNLVDVFLDMEQEFREGLVD